MIHSIRGLRALMWLRWRLLKNSLSGARKRDSLEQISRALGLLMPLLIVALSLGTFVAVSLVGFVGGRMMATGVLQLASGLLVLRLLLGLMMFAIVALAAVSPAQSTLSRYTRLLLLPIPRRLLHLVEVAAGLGDPWVAVVGAGLAAFALGLLAGGATAAAIAALVAAGLTVAVLVCAGSLVGFLVAWLMRDRRRGELLTLVFVMTFSLLTFIPAFLAGSANEGGGRGTGDASRITREIHQINVEEFDRHLPGWTQYLPSEVYGRTIAAALAADRGNILIGFGMLAAEAVLLFLASARVHRQMLGSLEGDQSRRRSTEIKLGPKPLPWFSAGESAVARALVRAALRTVRGRLTILLPGPMLALLVAVFNRLPQETWTVAAASRGYLLFGGSIVFTFYAMHAISMNLFGSDRAGLTLQLLSPITDRELAWGKIAGFAGIVAAGLCVCLAASVAVAHSGPLPYWIAVFLGAMATMCLISPVAIWFSAIFPVASDLSRTGSAGNPHPFPMIVGTLFTALFMLPTVGSLALAEFWFKSAAMAPVLAGVWMLIAAAIGLPMVNVAARSITARRENLALVAQGK
ncbi:MAG TPA: hypothetical protein VFV78_06420 [Vicinamibacterales bacterium]|nr:hypothetical protein [Vicinamibacterales bacterium]